MNRACQNCNRVITVPDIPLPKGYTQKCTACGHANVIGEDFDDSSSGSDMNLDALAPSDESWGPSFDTSMDFLNGPPESTEKTKPSSETDLEQQIIWRVEEKLQDLETRIRRELEQEFRQQPGDTQNEEGSTRFGYYHHLVGDHELLVCTQNPVIFQKCETVLQGLGYQIIGCDNPENAVTLLANNNYRVIVLDQQFLNMGEPGRMLFQQIKMTPLEIRRHQTIVLLTPGIAMGESQVFYQWGMDLNIHPRDLDRLDMHLTRVIELKHEMMLPYRQQMVF